MTKSSFFLSVKRWTWSAKINNIIRAFYCSGSSGSGRCNRRSATTNLDTYYPIIHLKCYGFVICCLGLLVVYGIITPVHEYSNNNNFVVVVSITMTMTMTMTMTRKTATTNHCILSSRIAFNLVPYGGSTNKLCITHMAIVRTGKNRQKRTLSLATITTATCSAVAAITTTENCCTKCCVGCHSRKGW